MRGALLAVLVLAVLPASASAYWSGGGGAGTGSGATSSLAPALISVPSTATTTVTVSFTAQAAVADNPAASPVTYVVQRAPASTGVFAATTTGTCAGTLTRPVTSCTDTVTTNGTYLYRVVASYATWTATSTSVSVTATPDPPPTVSSIATSGAASTNAPSVSWTVTFSESVTGVDTSDFSLVRTGGVTGGTLAVTGTGATRTVTASGLAGDGTLGLNLVDDDTIKDTGGNSLGGTGTGNGNFTGQLFTLDHTAPQLQTLQMFDTNGNGRVDQVRATFGETLASYTAGTTPWTLSNVPSNGTLSSVSVSGQVATLTLTEGAGAASTAVGTFKVALAANANGIRDALGNTSSFAARAPDDKAGPALLLGGSENSGLIDGKIEPGDSVTALFSEPVLASSVPAAPSITESRTGTANVMLSVPGVFSDPLNLGTPNYLAGAGAAVFAGTATVASANVTVTVGTCSSGCLLPVRPPTAPTAVFAPATTITDAAGNPATGTQSITNRLF